MDEDHLEKLFTSGTYLYHSTQNCQRLFMQELFFRICKKKSIYSIHSFNFNNPKELMKHIAPLKRHIFNYCETGMNRLDALFIFLNYI